ncbi:cold shock domain-containing protein [Amycolatopsis acidiphila]|uniref:Cold shock domain-containing protein n=1 Tax=Amycolatopsis acidiphila TaxID=715473 RepID=A0A558A7F7_9PSEU|nr:cold shock domain-containing protein [Amycolatopsis acidiphila]TVT20197.1 cold shock domain-containing protein [Amycolatopsis acidiphila]UIJ58258.1 cold shock domain-containing protein [Amycolatopsis acidiphila]GHG69141.1 DNA-binding protein [Amycolatopsis acidiphila]
MVTGKVVRFDEMRGYGFVAPESGGEDVFVHVNDLDVDKRLIAPGAIVEFTVEDGERGPKASNVRIVRDARPAIDEDYLPSGLDFREELTEALLTGAPTLTAEQVLRVRKTVLELVHEHGWLDE